MIRWTETGSELITGLAGSGKSMLVMFKLIMFLMQGWPFMYIDPKGDNFPKLIAWLAANPKGQAFYRQHWQDIVMITPTAKADYMTCFNVLKPEDEYEYADPDRVSLLAGSLTSAMKKVSGYEIGMANRMENFFLAGLALLSMIGMTLSEYILLFTRGEYQEGAFNNFLKWGLASIADRLPYGIDMFFNHQYKQWSEMHRHEWAQSSEGQAFRYLDDDRARCTLCADEQSTVNWREVIRQRKWVLVNIPFHFMGSDDITAIVGNLIVSKLFLACMQENREATPYRVFVDELKVLQTGPWDRILEVGRAYGMPVTLIVQSLNQLIRAPQGGLNYNLYDAVLTNCRYWTVFNSYIKDATVLAEQMFGLTGMVTRGLWEPDGYLPPQVEQNQYVRSLATLPKRQCVLYDKTGEEISEPDVWWTPDVNIPAISEAEYVRFVAEHQRRTGRSRVAIKDELDRRHRWVVGLINEKPERRNPRKESGTNVIAKE